MPLMITLEQGEGISVDQIDIWLLRAILEGGTAAEFVGPSGDAFTLRQRMPFRVGPGFRLSIQPAARKDAICLVVDAYVPLIQRHPPREDRNAMASKGEAIQ